MGNTNRRHSPASTVRPPRTSVENRLFSAIQDGDVDAVRNLIAQGAHPNTVFTDGLTPLILASGLGHVEIVECLLSLGCQNQQARSGDTPRQGHCHVSVCVWTADKDIRQRIV